jgi:hypothetical protein
MALKVDWSSLDQQAVYVMRGDGFVINDYGHPSFIRYIEGNRLLTLSYRFVDETAHRGRRFLFLRTYSIHVQVPAHLTWDDGTVLPEREGIVVLDRICRTIERYKKHTCRAVVNDELYDRLARIDAEIRARRSP